MHTPNVPNREPDPRVRLPRWVALISWPVLFLLVHGPTLRKEARSRKVEKCDTVLPHGNSALPIIRARSKEILPRKFHFKVLTNTFLDGILALDLANVIS